MLGLYNIDKTIVLLFCEQPYHNPYISKYNILFNIESVFRNDIYLAYMFASSSTVIFWSQGAAYIYMYIILT